MTAGLQLGAPRVYRAPPRVDQSFRPVRLDVAGFVGVALRGPVDEPILVRSLTEYQLRFGELEGPGLLPHAVETFFKQGGERAYVLRVGATTGAPAIHTLSVTGAAGSPVQFAAADVGTWGDLLRLTLELDVAQQFTVVLDERASIRQLKLPDGVELRGGEALRVRGPGLDRLGEFRYVEDSYFQSGPRQRSRWVTLDRPLPTSAIGGSVSVAVLEGTLLVVGPTMAVGNERITGLGLHPNHRRFLGRSEVLRSLLVTPTGSWMAEPDGVVLPNPSLAPIRSRLAERGVDNYQGIGAASFFDGQPDDPPDDDPLDERPHRGVDKMARVAEIGLLVVPDLTWGWLADGPMLEVAAGVGSPLFEHCVPLAPTTYAAPAQRMVPLDPGSPDDLREIVARQLRLVAVADRYRRFVVLLDVPSGLSLRAIQQWRAAFNSSYAAAYHPWLSVDTARAPVSGLIAARRNLEPVPPSAIAAGVVAGRERRFGLSWGPANELAGDAVRAFDPVSDAEHDRLHQLGVNVFRIERDGFRLSAARTLSRDPQYRQLTVRRLMTMLRLALEREAQWVVFEPATADLRRRLHHHLVAFLRELYRAGAFAGRSEEEAFFVDSGANLNSPQSLELGRLVVEVGVAPSEPIEYIVLRVERDADGGVLVEEADRGTA
ncbi:hypothetical protein EV644_12434 [Kribbella orskensis]|uniref:Tail sheath protein C-terminal domain-containing protein n=1 Tax=Kribbella orskensis TaxID=2512216 RepID=A0ABY2BBU8_9ACTN|nr:MULTISPECIES: phage tail sheath C-terminal domain-containing protein [Kribbella]TCN32772.1 hypothetical protein EV642_12664 [Kribbella sp. VKM Ac-2500]TCO12910.1 hypothetical protein EV644_12434 [Kribbella orskensis]